MTEPAVRRIEVFSGAGRRRRWSMQAKARIVAETMEIGSTVSGVARRHGLEASQVFAWRRAFRRAARPVEFAPVVVDGPEPSESGAGEGLIEIELPGAVVRIGRGADAGAITAVLAALK